MEYNELIKALEPVIQTFAALLGSDTEIAVHDLRERKLVYIVNGHVTGRKAGYEMPSSIYETILALLDTQDYVIGYATHSSSGKKIRASHVVLRDGEGQPVVLICINQDPSHFEELRDYLDTLVRSRPINESAQALPEADDENYIQKVTQHVILETIERSKPSGLDTREKKLEVISTLDAKGVFTVKDAVPIVCKIISISQATLYNYLREIRSQAPF